MTARILVSDNPIYRLNQEDLTMERKFLRIVVASIALMFLVPFAAQAKDIKITHTAGKYRFELNVLNAEAFAPAGGAPQSGMGGMPGMGHGGMMMVVKGGAAPVPLDDPSHPNHHLVVHVIDKASGKPLTDATVTIGVTPLDQNGKDVGATMQVPVAVMEASGMGAASTHYGNNVTLAPGSYRVEVNANGVTSKFRIKL
jgi:5-hydroxyisourate hydrolase-like protein (transthyretin family)